MRAQEGDHEALETIVRCHRATLLAAIRSHSSRALVRAEPPADVLQSVWCVVFSRLHSFRYRDARSFQAWLKRVTLTTVLERERYHRASKRDHGRELGKKGDPHDPPSREAGPLEAAEAREDMARIREALRLLPEHYRSVLVLHAIDGLSHARIARRLGRSSLATRRLLVRARARLRVLLSSEGVAG